MNFNFGLIFLIALAFLLGSYLPKLMSEHRDWGRLLVILLLVALTIFNWKTKGPREAYVYFEIVILLLFGIVDYLREFWIKVLMLLVLIATGILGLTLYRFEMTVTDVMGVVISSAVALYGFAYLGYLVVERREMRAKRGKAS
ncbi:hypothetical protein JCM16138_18620 [Thermococcus atlanticus]